MVILNKNRVAVVTAAVATLAGLVNSGVVNAAVFTKADNTTPLNTTGSYTTSGVPTSTDTILFDSNLATAANATGVNYGGNLSVAGLSVTNPIANVVISGPSSQTLTLGAAGIDLTGSRDLTFGATAGSGGKLALNDSTINIGTGRKLSLNNVSGSTTSSGTITLTGPGTFVGGSGGLGSAALVIGGGIKFDGNSSSFSLSNSSYTINSNFSIGDFSGGGKNFTLNGGPSTLTASRTISSSGQAILNSQFTESAPGSGLTIALSNNSATSLNSTTSSFTGAFNLTGTSGTNLTVKALANGGVASSIGASSNAASNLVLGGTTALIVNAATPQSTDRLFTLSGATATITNTGATANTLSFTSTGNVAYSGTGTRSLTLGGSNAGNNTFALAIGNNGASATSLNKTGAGKWIITNTANSYTGGTNISGGTLASGTSNVLSDGTALNVGTTNGAGTYDFDTFTDTVASLTAGNGTNSGTLNFNLGSNAQLLTTTGAVTLTNAVLNFGGTPTLGKYTVIKAGGALTNTSSTINAPTGYRSAVVVGTGGEVDLFALAKIGTVTGNSATIITGGTTNLTGTVANSAPVGGDALNFSVNGGPTASNVAAGSTGNFTTSFTSNTVGTNNVTLTASGTDAATGGAVTSNSGTATVNVLDHSSPSLTASANFGTVITGATVNSTASLANAAGNRAGLQVTNTGGLTDSGSGLIAAGNARNLSASATTNAVGAYSQAYTVQTSDDQTLAGATANGPLTFTVTGNVLDHSSPSLTSSANFGTVITGATVADQIATLSNAAGNRAGLQVTNTGGLTDSGSGLIAAGNSRTLSASVNTGTVGNYSQSFTVATSDDTSLAGATANGNQTFSVTGNVLAHSEGSFLANSDSNVLNLDVGSFSQNSGNQTAAFSIFNLLSQLGSTAGLDLTNITVSNDTTALSTNLATFNALTAGSSADFLATLDTSSVGSFSESYTLFVADDGSIAGATSGTNLTLNLSGTVTPVGVPEPTSLAVIALGGMAVLGRRRRRAC